MSGKWSKQSNDGEREAVRIVRDFDFRRTTVFEHFTDPRKAAKLWSPEGAVKVHFEFDARPGGAIRMHDRHADGTEGKTTGTVLQVVAPELLVVSTATAINGAAPPFEVLQTLRFEELGPTRTRLIVLVRLVDLGAFPGDASDLEGGFRGGWGQTLDILERELGSASSS